jgi:hypothetical protein
MRRESAVSTCGVEIRCDDKGGGSSRVSFSEGSETSLIQKTIALPIGGQKRQTRGAIGHVELSATALVTGNLNSFSGLVAAVKRLFQSSHYKAYCKIIPCCRMKENEDCHRESWECSLTRLLDQVYRGRNGETRSEDRDRGSIIRKGGPPVKVVEDKKFLERERELFPLDRTSASQFRR